MKPSRTLSVKKETLAELTSAEMQAVVAAQVDSGTPCNLTDAITNPVCVPTCGPMCTGTSTQTWETSLC